MIRFRVGGFIIYLSILVFTYLFRYQVCYLEYMLRLTLNFTAPPSGVINSNLSSLRQVNGMAVRIISTCVPPVAVTVNGLKRVALTAFRVTLLMALSVRLRG
jgi:hypothetical protein